jgi:membrane protein
MFTVGQVLIGLYLGKTSVGSAYGAASSLMIVLLWVFFSSCILFPGAEFTQVYSNMYGSKIGPTENAVGVPKGVTPAAAAEATKNAARPATRTFARSESPPTISNRERADERPI